MAAGSCPKMVGAFVLMFVAFRITGLVGMGYLHRSLGQWMSSVWYHCSRIEIVVEQKLTMQTGSKEHSLVHR